jgi:hypothetical protein
MRCIGSIQNLRGIFDGFFDRQRPLEEKVQCRAARSTLWQHQASRQRNDCTCAAQANEIPAIRAEIATAGIQAFNPGQCREQ